MYAKLSRISPEVREKLLEGIMGMRPGAMRENQRVSDVASRLIGKPVDEWPPFDVIWDTSLEGQRFSLDGAKPEEFSKQFPEPLLFADVDLSDLDENLTSYCKRTPEEIWGVGVDSKAAALIVRWSEGMKITPPFLKPYNDKVNLRGGHHRLAVARAKAVKRLPVLVSPGELSELQAILKSLAIHAST